MPTGDPFDLPARLLEPEELQTLAEDVGRRPTLWREQLDRCTVERRYVDLHTDEHVGVWVISWMADLHDTGFHDHDGSSGGVHVAEGAIRHEHLRLGERPVGEEVAAGVSFCFDGSAIHRMRREPGAGDTVTVHAYSPPLEHTGQLGEAEDGTLHRWATTAADQLRPHAGQGTPST